VRSIPTTPLSQALWLLCVSGVVVMIFASTTVGIGLMIAAVVIYTIGSLAGIR
jgi:hypothetical protein